MRVFPALLFPAELRVGDPINNELLTMARCQEFDVVSTFSHSLDVLILGGFSCLRYRLLFLSVPRG